MAKKLQHPLRPLLPRQPSPTIDDIFPIIPFPMTVDNGANSKPSDDANQGQFGLSAANYQVTGVSPYSVNRRFFINNNWYLRQDDTPEPGKTYVIYVVQLNDVYCVQLLGDPDQSFVVWNIEQQETTGYFVVKNAASGMYLRREQGKQGVHLTSLRELASGVVPVRHHLGGFLLRWFEDKVNIPTESDPMTPYPLTFEFIKVGPGTPRPPYENLKICA